MKKHSDYFIEIAESDCLKEPIPYNESYFEKRKCDYCQTIINSSESYHEDYYLEKDFFKEGGKINIYRQFYFACKCNGIWISAYKNTNGTYTELYRCPLDISNCHLEHSDLFLININIEKENFLKPYLRNHDETKSKWEAYHRFYERIIDLGNHTRIIVMLKTGYPYFRLDFNENRFGLRTSISSLLRYSGLHLWEDRKLLSVHKSISLICSIMDSQKDPISLKRFVKETNIPELNDLDTNLNCEGGIYHDIKYLRDKQLEHNDFDFNWTDREITQKLLINVYSDIVLTINKLNDKKGIKAYFENQLMVEDESDVINSLLRELMIIEHSYRNRENNIDNRG